MEKNQNKTVSRHDTGLESIREEMKHILGTVRNQSLRKFLALYVMSQDMTYLATIELKGRTSHFPVKNIMDILDCNRRTATDYANALKFMQLAPKYLRKATTHFAELLKDQKQNIGNK